MDWFLLLTYPSRPAGR